ncbi:MAG: transglycosylase SLT domain-containing protein [Steroidobacteraceae bacterium]
MLIVALVSAFLGARPAAAATPDSTAAPTPGAAPEFMAAMQRVRMNLPEPPDSPALKTYPIYDYLVAARLRRDLAPLSSDELDATIDTFLRAHEGQPVGRSLKHQWLVSLAQRRRWDWFLPRAADLTDPALLCDRLAGRLATGDTDHLAADALARWNLPQREPLECAPVDAWLRLKGLLTPALLEARARAALAADNPTLAREFVAQVPAERTAPLNVWLQLLESPKSSLTTVAMTPQTPVEADALVAGFTRLANTDVPSAASLLPKLLARPDATPAVRGRLQRALALGEAYARQAGAVAAFEAVPAEFLDAQVQEWRVRAAVWAGDYGKALEWTQRMPPTLASQPRWRYWHARATAATAGAAAAAPLFAQIAGLRDYYGYLAADRLHQPYDLNIHPAPDDPSLQNTLAADPGLIRAHALFDCDLTDDATAEWNAALVSMGPAVKIQAARLASRWGWYAEAIAMLAQADSWDDVPLRYPRPFPAIIAQASKLTGVPPDWILAIIRQESLFRKDAVSRADARGLMQMQPGTASAVAKRWHLPAPGRDNLFDPAVAIPLGAAYVHELLERYGQQLDLCLAAYNAGPVSVARWLPAQAEEADAWIENIPYSETRAYVEHVLEHIVAFAAMRDADPPRLSGLLPPVLPSTPVAEVLP